MVANEAPTQRVLKRPAKCSCGGAMLETPEGAFMCGHCDFACDKTATGCVYCNAFKVGSRPKNSFFWNPSSLYTDA